MGIRLLKIASVYFLLAIILGMFMSITHQFNYAPSHAHIGLLGWTSLALAGIIYHLFPDAARNKLATSHFWLHNIGLPIMMIGLLVFETGKTAFEPVIAIGATLTSLGVVLFVINVLLNVKSNP
ncbi:cytochrome-c oxidase [Aneurinibacillus uraniidurans]|uniref:cytochrome-c oxidase n=1 Tax=Aneurinibacillus uraniidurans TaxID=2966586 RepID=UPI00234AF97B|nr:cytochrome-c oxidase [Aneurinibacillus sp. B1]WCN36225.1 cytochrome-c oxidase [Aneurinibacillus sp. B1]